MTRRRLSTGMFFALYLIIAIDILTPTQLPQLQELGELCVKHNSVSYRKMASQSSSASTAESAAKAVDGDNKTCSKTATTMNPWWQVDIGKEIYVSFIQVKNSLKHPLVINIYISKYQNQNGTFCGVKHVLEGGETRWIICDPQILGRFVKIQVPIDTQEYLSLCEVQIFDQTVDLTEGVIYEAWFDIGLDSKLQSLLEYMPFISNHPDSRGIVSIFQSPRNIADGYGIKMVTYYNAPQSGEYKFFMSGDNECKLSIRQFSKREIIKVAVIPRDGDVSHTPFDQWNGSNSQPQTLERDIVYKLTAHMKEGDGLDHLRVGVRLPNGQYELPLKHRIFTSAKAAQARTINQCKFTTTPATPTNTSSSMPTPTNTSSSMPTPTNTSSSMPTPTKGRRTTQELGDLYQSLLNGKKTPVNASVELFEITSDTNEFVADDVTLTALSLENIVNYTAALSETGPNIVKTVNNILNVKVNVIGESERNNKSSKRIIFVIQKYLENVPINHGKNVSQNEENLAIQAQDWNVTDFHGVQVTSVAYVKNGEEKSRFIVFENDTTDDRSFTTKASLTVPKVLFETLESKREEQRLFFVVFRKTSLFQGPSRNTEKKTNSFIIAASVKGQEVKNLTEPVEIVYFPLVELGKDESPVCVFWDFNLNNGQGDWSESGCYYKGTNNGLVNCNCYHLTNFAMLMDVDIDDHNDVSLSIISYIGCAVSLFGLVLTIITILIFKDLRSKVPSQILLNFCIALSLTLVVFLAAAERSKTSSMTGCRAAAVALHYFVLVVFMWMAIQAFNMVLAFVIVLPKHYSRFIQKCCIVGWGVPAIIIIITTVTSIDSYGDKHFCRVNGLPFFVGLLAPVLLILLGNTIAFVVIFRSLLASATNVTTDQKISILHQAKRAAAILYLLGLTWLFGVLAIKDAKLVFQYLFCIFNSIQGLIVFLFYCALSTETRAKYKSLLFGKSSSTSSSRIRQTTTLKSMGSLTVSTRTLPSSTSLEHVDNNAQLEANPKL